MLPNVAPAATIGRSQPDIGRVLADDGSPSRLEERIGRAERLACVGQLVTGFVHEINTPLQYVGDNLRLIEEALARLVPGLQDASGRELLAETPACVASAIEGIERIAGIVRDMQAVAATSNRSASVADVNGLVETAITATRAEWKYVATITVDLEASLPPIVCGAGDLVQAFVNVLVNAAQSIAEARASNSVLTRGGVITVSTRSFPDSIEVRVADDGIGIAPEAMERVFDPFFATKPCEKAAGLGLALAERVVRRHGGRIYAESKRGQGSMFIIALPIRDDVE